MKTNDKLMNVLNLSKTQGKWNEGFVMKKKTSK